MYVSKSGIEKVSNLNKKVKKYFYYKIWKRQPLRIEVLTLPPSNLCSIYVLFFSLQFMNPVPLFVSRAKISPIIATNYAIRGTQISEFSSPVCNPSIHSEFCTCYVAIHNCNTWGWELRTSMPFWGQQFFCFLFLKNRFHGVNFRSLEA